MNKRLLIPVLLMLLGHGLAYPDDNPQGHHDADDGSHEDEHGHDDTHEPASGPHGGKLLSDHDLTLEVTLYATGIAPELRIYASASGVAVAPQALDLQVTLRRLGDQVEHLTFTPEYDYWVSDTSVAEPHSFDVEISAHYRQRDYRWHYATHEGRTRISARMLKLAGIATERAAPRLLRQRQELFGVISAPQDAVYHLVAPYPSTIDSVAVAIGDRVKKGQLLARLRSTETLQTYRLSSPARGEVTARHANAGEAAAARVLIEITNLEQVWVDMSAFPEAIEQLALGQPVTVRDLHQHESARGEVSYISPVMTGGHIARARAVIANTEGHWRPGMHVLAEVITAERKVPLAVRASALQTLHGKPVVFARYGDIFEARMLTLGDTDGAYVEVLDGLSPATEYATTNSFVVKADILKHGASHAH